MPGSKVNNYSVGDPNLTALMDAADKQRIGYHAVSLTEYYTTNEPSIAAGSVIEINGTLYEFLNDEPIYEDSNLVDGAIYIRCDVSGTSVTAEFTNEAPEWDDEKQGWYKLATNSRYLNFVMELDTGTFINKSDYEHRHVYGYMNDGTPLYSKEINVVVGNGDYQASAAHGIKNARTNDRIVIIRSRNIGATYTSQADGHSGAVDNEVLDYFAWDNTSLIAIRAGNTGEETFICFIVYK